MSEGIDFVIAWVDGNDMKWQKEKNKYASLASKEDKNKLFGTWSDNPIRFRDWEILEYWFRGIEKFSPWVNKIHFVTWGHLPAWLNTDHPKLNIVNHKDYIPKEYLPTFNSHTIELNLHRIKDLSNQFVYFNDDMFLLKEVKPSDFFKNELPCDSAVLNTIPINRNFGHAEINNISVINDYFKKNQVLKENWSKWFNVCYGADLLRTFLLLPWKDFIGLYEQHLPSAFSKKTFEYLWEIEREILNKSSEAKFRENGHVNQWLFKNWQIVTGEFFPRKTNIGKVYHLSDNNRKIYDAIEKQRYKMICVNDLTDIVSFETEKKLLRKAFETILPLKSEFEL